MTSYYEKELDGLYDELKFVRERRSKLSIMKLAFIAAFFGIGSVKVGDKIDQRALYLVPTVAVLFDLFAIASTVKIKELSHEIRCLLYKTDASVSETCCKTIRRCVMSMLQFFCDCFKGDHLSHNCNLAAHCIIR